ncbi:jg26313 [Pararge aegeria aegeria]|uniref:Jg26313 protein n=1 Tax=Pararge aegeria aegeria TaxID=348720 RepID=A0A8S4R8M0_9NEOP|nr:jg26313 [Pararge aegeria aegeria]
MALQKSLHRSSEVFTKNAYIYNSQKSPRCRRALARHEKSHGELSRSPHSPGNAVATPQVVIGKCPSENRIECSDLGARARSPARRKIFQLLRSCVSPKLPYRGYAQGMKMI